MGEKSKKFARYLYVYGIYGIYLYMQVFWFKKTKINLKNFGPVYLRKKTFDDEIFTQMFIYKQYNFGGVNNVKTVVDLGGNNGMSALFFHKKYPEATIYVLEPDKENFKALQAQVNGIDKIIALNKAIWKENGTVNLDTGDSWAIKIDMTAGKNMAEAITMDTLIATYGINQIDLLKIDIETAEKELFEGPTAFLSKTRNLCIELHDWIRPGCARSFFSALYNYSYNYTVMHENTIILDIKSRQATSLS